MYIGRGGANMFREDTKIKTNYGKTKVLGKKMLPIYHALEHLEQVMAYDQERNKALFLIMWECKKWLRDKADKAKKSTAARRIVVNTLLGEAFNDFVRRYGGGSQQVAEATYQMRKSGGTKETIPLYGGYVTERIGYVASNKQVSIAGSFIADLANTPGRDRFKTQLLSRPEYWDEQAGHSRVTIAQADVNQLRTTFGVGNRTIKTFEQLNPADWAQIAAVAGGMQGRFTEVRYMRKQERMNYMLEKDGMGGLRCVVGGRSAQSGDSQWPYAMDEYGSIYTANDTLERGQFGMFNHSTFTAGDNVVCAGMLKINARGKLVEINNASGHYHPTEDQLKAVVAVLVEEYEISLDFLEVFLLVGAMNRSLALGTVAVQNWLGLQ